MAASACWASMSSSGRGSVRQLSSHSSLKSFSITTQGTMPPPVTRWGAISTTVPETEACTGAETKPRTSPTF